MGNEISLFEKDSPFYFPDMRHRPLATLNLIAQILYDKKGLNILALDVYGLSSITDYFLIAEGNVDRHVLSMAHAVIDELEARKGPPLLHAEGMSTGDWVVLDYGEIMVHLFMPGLRERYALERLWKESKLIDLDLNVSEQLLRDL